MKLTINGWRVNTARATARYEEAWDRWGRRRVGRVTGLQRERQTLFRVGGKGRWCLVHEGEYRGNPPRGEWIGVEAAVRWLVLNGHEAAGRAVNAVNERQAT